MTSAHLCAQLAEAAYLSFLGLRPRLDRLGFELLHTYDTRGTQGFMATRDDQVVVAFPGTADKRDFFTDMKYIKTDLIPRRGLGPTYARSRVHQGFWRAYLNIADALHSDLSRCPGPLTFVGHSLGAGIAMLAATAYPDRWPGVRVFGCPRVGNKRFAELPGYLDVIRYENWFDGVTFVPPRTSPWQAIHSWRHDRPVTLYTHRGASVTLPGRGHGMEGYVRSARDLDKGS